jgi:hypothetical protein
MLEENHISDITEYYLENLIDALKLLLCLRVAQWMRLSATLLSQYTKENPLRGMQQD